MSCWYNTAFFLLSVGTSCLAAERMVLSWPTANPAFAKGDPYRFYVQPTSSENPIESGIYGCVRNKGFKFHEGLDLKPVKVDAAKRPLDTVFAVMDGVVSHRNLKSGDSSYGIYLVLEHPDVQPAVYTLYAHLSRVEPGLTVGSRVKARQPLGRMGNTAGGYRIPMERAHLHYEIGLRLTDHFQPWYDRRKFGSPNRHGKYNGMNLVGFDPIPFCRAYLSKQIKQPVDYLKSLPTIAVVRGKSSKVPDFAVRYPSLSSYSGKGTPKVWDVSIGPAGLPLRCDPAPPNAKSPSAGSYEVLSYKSSEDDCSKCRRLFSRQGKSLVPAYILDNYLDLIFGN